MNGLPRRAAVVLLGAMAVVWTFALLVFGWLAIDDARGATVDAEVVSVRTDVPGRRVYEVEFTTGTGRHCRAEVDSGSNPPARDLRVGGRSKVHYPASDPCGEYVRESSSPPPWPLVFVAPFVVIACVAGARHLRRPAA